MKKFWLVLKCIHDLQQQKHTKQKTKQKNKKIERKKYKKNQNIYESRIKLIFFNFTFFTFQMNNIFNYLKKELIIQHACVV